MKNFIVRDSSDNLYAMSVPTKRGWTDDVYRQFAKDVLNIPDAEDPDFDVGNIDIDVFEIPAVSRTNLVVFEGDEDPNSEGK